MMKRLAFLLCLMFMPQINGALGEREYLTKAACERNPNLAICQRIKKNLPHVQSVPVLKHATREVRSYEKREKHELSEPHSETRRAHDGEDVAALQKKCLRLAPIVQKHCEKNTLRKENIARCVAYFKDCSRFFSPADPLYSIANTFSSAVDLNFATVDVNGIPYYPINEEGSVGVGVLSHIPFGSWGGGYSDHVGIRDYWSQYQEAGANWYEGKYGYKNGWSVPLVQSLGIEGGQHNTVSAPLDRKNLGKVMVDNGYGVGGYYGHNDHVDEDWKKGHVSHNFGVGSPFVGTGVNTGQAIAFPSLDTFMNAGRK